MTTEKVSRSESVARTCATCACALIRVNPANPEHRQMFCELNPPGFQVVKVQVPRLHPKTKEPMFNPRNEPLMDTVEQSVYIYPPTMPELRCFSGWRPIGAEPGKHDIRDDMAAIMDAMQPILNSLGIFKAPLDG